jgi:LPXTG-site transpeptidase (sortase) family protein
MDPHSIDQSPLSPGATPGSPPDPQTAADLVRQKVARIYSDEPNASAEMTESQALQHRSKHQQFMYELSTSGKDLATVQTEWHLYYQSLPDAEKHQVWQEFYASQSLLNAHPAAERTPKDIHALAENKQQASQTPHAKKRAHKPKVTDIRSVKDVQEVVRDKVTAGGKLETKHHLQSLLFGLAMGVVVLIIFLFGFFNEVIIAPFIQPSRTAAATPLIVSSSSIAPTSNPEVIIPKINVEIPVDYSQNTTDENQIENALESGVVHYPTTVRPGETGNAAFFGHSSNNIFNKGKYKFAFVLLHTLVPGDTFYLTYQGKVYVYKVISRTIVDPSEVGVLGPVPGQTATATLITCDPPGTSLKRLIVVGQQISPDPNGNSKATQPKLANSQAASSLPGNGPTLLGRLARTTIGKLLGVVILLAAFITVVRWVNKPVRQAGISRKS